MCKISGSVAHWPKDNFNSKQGHECLRCGHIFTRMDNMKRHLKYVCGMPPQFQCILCSYATKHKYVLAIHMKSRHPDVVITES